MNPIPVVYEDDDICIINKPSGLAVQGGAGVVSAVDTVLSQQLGSKVYLVHRLDKDTAGLLITAKNPRAASVWTKRVASGDVQKEYCALCIGEFLHGEGTISDPVVHKGTSQDALTFFCAEKQSRIKRAAANGFEQKNDSESEKDFLCFSLVRLVLGTGRMHQIRIHLAGRGTPIAGDDKYGDFKLNRILRKEFGIKKLHLAAVCLRFSEKCVIRTEVLSPQVRSVPGFPCALQISLPDYMNKTLSVLEFAP